MINNNTSALYNYVKYQVHYRGLSGIGHINIQKAYDSLCHIIDQCCMLHKNYKITNPFLRDFYAILNTMILPRDMHRIKKVKKLLHPYVERDCCN